MQGSSSGSVEFAPAANAGSTIITLPITSGTMTALGNTTTGSGSIVLATSPSLTTPTITTSATINAGSIITDTTTGLKVGTSTSQKLGFFNSTPVVQPTGDVATGLSSLGLISSPTVSVTPATGTLPIAHGGTGSITQNFVDLSSNQTIAGIKTFTGEVIVPTPVNSTDAATKTYVDNSSLQIYSVKAYGAVGNGTTDDTSAIQAAINAANSNGGGVVYFEGATYKITSALTLYSSITLQGVGEESSVIYQTTTTANGLVATDAASICLRDIMIKGPGSGSGIGIYFQWSSAGNNPYHNFTNIYVEDFGSDGIKMQTPIVSIFHKVVSYNNGGNGFNWYAAGLLLAQCLLGSR